MPASTRKSSGFVTARVKAAKQAEAVAHSLHSFAAAITALEAAKPWVPQMPTPRNWWKLQAGRFKNDSTFGEFVAEVQAARKLER